MNRFDFPYFCFVCLNVIATKVMNQLKDKPSILFFQSSSLGVSRSAPKSVICEPANDE
jgi:hypothetical protein